MLLDRIERYSFWILASILICISVGFLLKFFYSGIQIDNDLKSLAPKLHESEELTRALNVHAAQNEKKFVMGFVASDENALFESLDFFNSQLKAAVPEVIESNYDELVDRYLELLSDYPGHFLLEEDRQLISNSSSETLFRRGIHDLYSGSSGVRLFPVTTDPIGSLNRYALDALDGLPKSADEPVTLVIPSHLKNKVLFDESYYFISASFELDATAMNFADQQRIVNAISALSNKTMSDFPGVSVLRSGVVFFAGEASAGAQKDVSFIGLGSAIGACIIIFVVFKNPIPLVIPIISITLGVCSAFVVTGVLFEKIHILAIVFGASLIGVVVDYSLHYVYFYASHSVDFEKSKLHRALFLSLMSSVIGYCALSMSGLPALIQISVFSATGLIVSWLSVLVCGKFFVEKIRASQGEGLSRSVAFLLMRMRPPISLPLSLLLIVFALAGFATMSLNKLSYEDSPRSFIASSQSLITEDTIVKSNTSPFEPSSLLVVTGENESALFESLSELGNRLDKDFPILGVHNFIASPEEQMRSLKINEKIYGEGQVGEKILESLEAGSQFLEDTEEAVVVSPGVLFSLSEDSLLPLWFQDRSKMTTLVMLKHSGNYEKLNKVVNGLPEVEYFNLVDETGYALKALRGKALYMLGLAIVFLFVLAIVYFRKIGSAFIVFIPAFSILCTLYFLGLAGVAITLFHVMALFLVLGLGMDYVVFVAEIRSNAEQTLSAVTLSAVTSLLAFGLLSLSSMPVIQAFGLTVLIGNSFNLLGCFLLSSLINSSRLHAKHKS